MSSRCQLLALLLLGVVALCQCHVEIAETSEVTTEPPLKEPTTTEAVVITGVVLSTTAIVLLILLPTIAIDKYKKAKKKINEPVPAQ